MLTKDGLHTLTTAQFSTFPNRPLTRRTCTLQKGMNSPGQSLYTDALLQVRSHIAQSAISCLVRALLQLPKEQGAQRNRSLTTLPGRLHQSAKSYNHAPCRCQCTSLLLQCSDTKHQ